MEGVDYSFSKPSAAGLKAAGKHFAFRYLTGSGKRLDANEKRDLLSHGIAIGLVYESTGGRALSGFNGGRDDAHKASQARRDLGLTDAVIYFAVDFDVTTQMGRVKEYLKGAASVLGNKFTGVYGEYNVIETMVPGVVGFGWQTYAWSGGRVSDKAHVLQYRNGQKLAGGTVDLCRSLKPDFGQHPRPHKPAPHPGPKPPPPPPPKPAPTPPDPGEIGRDKDSYLSIQDKDGQVRYEKLTKTNVLRRVVKDFLGKKKYKKITLNRGL